jgi:hypothetical protein
VTWSQNSTSAREEKCWPEGLKRYRGVTPTSGQVRISVQPFFIIERALCAEGQRIQNSVRSASKYSKIKNARAPVAQVDRASAF